MRTAKYHLDPAHDALPSLGFILLQADETIEGEIRQSLATPGLNIHISRVPSGADLTVETIAEMERNLPAASRLLPDKPEYDVVGYACTSGTTLIGPDRVVALVRQNCRARHVTDPMTAAIAAFRHLNVTSIALVTPYVENVSEPVRREFERADIKVASTVSFGEQVEANVARISAASIREAAMAAMQGTVADAVFLSCTNLKTRDVIPVLEADLGVPVVSSNLALFWHMAMLVGQVRQIDAKARLLTDA